MISETTSPLNSIPKQAIDVPDSVPSTVETLRAKRQESADERQALPPLFKKDQPLTSQELEAVVIHLNDFLQNIQRELQFSVDEESGRNVVKVIDSLSDKVIRQIPSEDMLAVARRFQRDDSGLLANEMA